MFYLSALVFPAMLLILAAVLIAGHRHTWRQAQEHNDEVEYHRRQFRRRVQTSLMLGLLALGLGIGQFIPGERHPTAFVLFWFGVLLLLGWIVLLALGDLVLGRRHVSRLQHEQRIAEAQLKAEVDRVQQRLADEKTTKEPPPGA